MKRVFLHACVFYFYYDPFWYMFLKAISYFALTTGSETIRCIGARIFMKYQSAVSFAVGPNQASCYSGYVSSVLF